ncbi:UDP-N-acetylmuramate dehydrogenase [Reichenbachiella carrageenanivorans]|uniref:UDP-N-acetylenolpyruvoylglucosamine reductase n=1 Tax=Reichenbachiella carrageenanivorans TaxID=2979869 RepID=A0ABY6D036_9BACT|nr:UDP-N-acetylmuramate dehydrogenase [Reichenbachiella carrageenanivorans]UXX79054.1 UDP-N-acetylmuramate dehydrogenase [Reichenbachiella carrageenanivorans]
MPQFLKEAPLSKFNTFGIDAVADFMIEVSNNQEIKESMVWADQERLTPVILGGGSNVLFTQPSYPLVIVNRLMGIEKIKEDEEYVWVRSGAGEVWHQLVLYCITQGWGGVENLSLIPGTVGAAPMQNIGAYGIEIKEVFESLEAIHLTTFEVKKFSKADCQFGYRESVFKKDLKGKYFITSVVLKLTKVHQLNTSYGAIGDVLSGKGITNPTIKQVSDAVIEIRQSKLPNPAEIGNAGSFFKNPVVSNRQFKQLRAIYPEMPNYPQPDGQVKVPAGWLIEKCGWKGSRFGAIGVHENQALVLVNHGGGSGKDIKALAMKIRKSVQDKFEIDITPEVNML